VAVGHHGELGVGHVDHRCVAVDTRTTVFGALGHETTPVGVVHDREWGVDLQEACSRCDPSPFGRPSECL
jgi:hypothetical protein